MPTIRIGTITGDLHIRPGPSGSRLLDDAGVRPLSDDHPLVDATGDAILEITGAGNVSIQLVQGDCVARDLAGSLELGTVRGDLTVAALAGPLVATGTQGGDVNLRDLPAAELRDVHGDLGLRQVRQVAVTGGIHGDVVIAGAEQVVLAEVHGDLTAQGVTGSLTAGMVHGDARIKDCAGSVAIESTQGDLAVQDCAGGVLATAEGDAYLETALAANANYTIVANEIVLRVRGPVSAQFVATSNDGEIHTHLPLTLDRHRQHLVGLLGNGEAQVTLTAEEDIILDAAGARSESTTTGSGAWEGTFGAHHVKVHLDPTQGPHITYNGPFGQFEHQPGTPFTGWPFGGDFPMGNPNNPNQSNVNMDEVEARIREFSERTQRAARKAAEKAREYAERAQARARETDWDAVSREIRTAVERTVSELEGAFREIAAEFNAPITGQAGGATQPRPNGATAQRIHIETDDEPAAAASATSGATPPPASNQSNAAATDARRRAILQDLSTGEISLEEAERRLGEL